MSTFMCIKKNGFSAYSYKREVNNENFSSPSNEVYVIHVCKTSVRKDQECSFGEFCKVWKYISTNQQLKYAVSFETLCIRLENAFQDRRVVLRINF